MKTFLIAEAGVNHDGNLAQAKALCESAKNCGADAVKFQTFIPERIALDKQELSQLKKYDLGKRGTGTLKDFCDRIGIEFMSTPFCSETAQWLQDMEVKRFKISSGNVTNMSLLKKVASFRKQVILSLGMTTLIEREEAIVALLGYGVPRDKLVLMYCRSIYPVEDHQVCLGELRKLHRYKTRVGFSDHSMSTIIPTYAAVMGASYIEKHFTLDRSRPGADHAMSLMPNDFKAMVDGVRWAEQISAIGPVIMDEEVELKQRWTEKVRLQNGG